MAPAVRSVAHGCCVHRQTSEALYGLPSIAVMLNFDLERMV